MDTHTKMPLGTSFLRYSEGRHNMNIDMRLRNIVANDGTVNFRQIGEGGYSLVYLATFTTGVKRVIKLSKTSERMMTSDRILNEVGCLRHIRNNTNIPVPEVFKYSTEDGYIEMEYVEGDLLPDIWDTYTDDQKHHVLHQIVQIFETLCNMHGDTIGSIGPDGQYRPTIDPSKYTNGRNDIRGYDPGPYKSVSEYAKAYLKKEKLYHEHTTPEDEMDQQSFEDKKSALSELLELSSVQIDDEPIVMCHGDLHGRNIIMDGVNVCAIIDWEFGGYYPSSVAYDLPELTSGTDTDDDEDWDGVFRAMLSEKMKKMIFNYNPIVGRCIAIIDTPSSDWSAIDSFHQ